ncbi:MAG: HEAT repeat domain-containing protein, partial [Acidobacteriia bacterium]|nr:HEAT repeat domain-containing protein [Terriglobia bacterium]
TIHGVQRDEQALPFSYDGRKLVVRLDRPLRSGEEVLVAIEYEGHPRRGMYFIGPDAAHPDKPQEIWTQGEDEDSRYWFPCYDYPNDKASSEVVATVPSHFVAVSNGKLLGVQDDPAGGTRTYHWRQDIPHSAYLVTLAIGGYVEIADTYDGVPVPYYVQPGREEDARRAFGNTPRMLAFFSESIGVPYPYDKYAQVAVTDFIFGGMENTSATTQTAETLHDARAHLDFSSDPLVAHELAHQWWGDLLTCRDWAHGWLNEGFATYFEALWMEHDKGDAEFRYALHQDAHEYLEEDGQEYRRPIVCNVYREPIELFDRHLYQKGGWVLHMLRFVLGDTLFWKALQQYCRQHRGQNVVTADLQHAIEKATGQNLDWFFDKWVYKAGHPELEVSYRWDETDKLAHVTVKQRQDTQAPPAGEAFSAPVFRLPVVIDFEVDGGRRDFRVTLDAPMQTFHFPLAGRPTMVRFDPGNWVLKTLEFDPGNDLLLRQLQQDDQVMGRIFAAQGLAKKGDAQAVAALRSALLQDPFWGVQAEVAAALGRVRSSAALDALLEGLAVPHPKARRAVVKALGEFRDERAAAALHDVLSRGDASYFVEGQAAAALGKTKSPRAYEALVAALERGSYLETIRGQAFEGLAELKDARAIDVAKAWSAYGRPTRARAAAINCLGKLGDAHDTRKSEIVEFLGSLTADPEFRVRLSLPAAFETLKSVDALPHLQRLAEQELDGRIRRLARRAIESIKDGRGGGDELRQVRRDVEALRDENRQLRDRLDRMEATLAKGEPVR